MFFLIFLCFLFPQERLIKSQIFCRYKFDIFIFDFCRLSFHPPARLCAKLCNLLAIFSSADIVQRFENFADFSEFVRIQNFSLSIWHHDLLFALSRLNIICSISSIMPFISYIRNEETVEIMYFIFLLFIEPIERFSFIQMMVDRFHRKSFSAFFFWYRFSKCCIQKSLQKRKISYHCSQLYAV